MYSLDFLLISYCQVYNLAYVLQTLYWLCLQGLYKKTLCNSTLLPGRLKCSLCMLMKQENLLMPFPLPVRFFSKQR